MIHYLISRHLSKNISPFIQPKVRFISNQSDHSASNQQTVELLNKILSNQEKHFSSLSLWTSATFGVVFGQFLGKIIGVIAFK